MEQPSLCPQQIKTGAGGIGPAEFLPQRSGVETGWLASWEPGGCGWEGRWCQARACKGRQNRVDSTKRAPGSSQAPAGYCSCCWHPNSACPTPTPRMPVPPACPLCDCWFSPAPSPALTRSIAHPQPDSGGHLAPWALPSPDSPRIVICRLLPACCPA